MRQAATNLLRVFIAIVMSLGVAAVAPAGNCGAPASGRTCDCCRNPSAQSCCSAEGNESQQQQPSAPSSRIVMPAQPAALLHAVAGILFPPVATVHFSPGKITPCANAGGRAFQSVNCTWMV